MQLWFLACCLFDIFFFFSSRRRHTRSLRDWSSDVCSSDLVSTQPSTAGLTTSPTSRASSTATWMTQVSTPTARACTTPQYRRSEERRVGKECRSRWSPDHEKKKYKRVVGEVDAHKQKQRTH